ncbi:type II secretion system protein N [Gallaecimonas xiamenensis]|uniref:Type II secretion system protein N n=1 Tax=Gallaecimonas xiamenensis 3-C-1 TaxID=745411 RepID=K2KJR8_9GAMM|nr:type II secretion system protein N [Gallaecimonas xiamenensis]EKE77565.1 type II secretion system protein N [Gallaecimonas xiamenensis 3-C-1]
MRIIKWTLAGLLFFLVALAWQLPAALVLSQAPLPPGVAVSGVQGTIWQGQVAQLSVQGLHFEQLRWQTRPWALLTGQLSLHLSSRPGVSQLGGDLALGLGGDIALDNLVLKVPVAPLVADMRLPVPSQVSGQLSVALAQYRKGAPWCEALSGKAQWLDAAVTNNFGDFDLGRIDADLACDQGAITAVVRDTPPRLGLELEARLEGENYQVRGFARPADDQPKALKDAFAFFGKAGSDGRYPVQFQGRLPR